MTFIYCAAVIILIVLFIIAVAEYFFAFAIKRTKKPTNEFSSAFRRLLSGTDREYLLDEIDRGRKFLVGDCEGVSVRSRDGLRLCGRLFEHKNEASDTLIIFSHGYKSSAEVDFPVLSKRFFEAGCDILAIDQRATGKSEGKYYGFGVLERHDIEAWCRFARESFGERKRLVLFGCSMGAAAVLMALNLPFVRENVSAVVADCPFDLPEDEFRYILSHNYHLPEFPILPLTSFICKLRAKWRFDEFSASNAVAKTDVPILLIHGTADDFVPATSSVGIFEASGGKCEILLVDGAPHGFAFYREPERYLAKVDEFLKNSEKKTKSEVNCREK